MSDHRSRVCPHLGIIHDTATHMGFPSNENRCLISTSYKSPNPSHQQSFCLQRAHDTCELYHSSGGYPTPPEIFASSRIGRSSKRVVIVITLLIMAGVALIGGFFLASPESPWKDLPAETVAAVPAFETAVSPAGVTPPSTSTPAPSLISRETSTPQPASTLAPLANLHAFEITKMPAGTEQGYLVHIVAAGETLDMLAANYNTTVQALMAVNYKLKPPVWVEYPIVIPVGIQDAAGLPAFDVYVVDGYEFVTAESLADTLGVDATALEYYNLCTGNCRFNKGDVLLVPYTP